MTPAEYVTIVMQPTVAEFRSDPTDQRRAYLACITAFHLLDYLARAEGEPNAGSLCKQIRESGNGGAIKALNVVQGLCNGSKHGVTTRGPQLQFQAGEDRYAPVFALDVPGSGWDVSLWDHPGRIVVDESGTPHSVEACLKAFLDFVSSKYGRHLGGDR